MICPECKKAGLKSRVFVGNAYLNLISGPSFHDEVGKYHDHNLAIPTTPYHCSKGHKWSDGQSSKCWCGWPDTKEKMSGGLKITREITANPKYKKDLDKSIAQLRRGKLFARPKRAEHA